MKHITFLLISFLGIFFITGCKNKVKTHPKQEWVSIFNGKNLDDWLIKIKDHPLNENYNSTFIVEDDAIKVNYTAYDSFNDKFGHLFYKSPYSNYKIRFKYRFTGEQVNGGAGWATKNSGIMVHAQSPESMTLDQEFPVSIEVQLLGGLEEGKNRPTGNLCTPGTHVTMNNELVTDHCISSNSETIYGEEWVQLQVDIYNDSLITHYINDTAVMSYTKPIIGGNFNMFPDKEGHALKEGYFALQSESHPIEFKDIEILNLDEN
jgi:hypothetical protein